MTDEFNVLFVASREWMVRNGVRWGTRSVPPMYAVTPGAMLAGRRFDLALVHPSARTRCEETGMLPNFRDWLEESVRTKLASPKARLVFL